MTLAWPKAGASDISAKPFQILIHLPLALVITAVETDRLPQAYDTQALPINAFGDHTGVKT